MTLTVETGSRSDTERLAGLLAALLSGGELLLLLGELGAGKTCFVRGLVRGLGGNERQVRSPSYNILRQYAEPRIPLDHFDAYFVREEEEFRRNGLEEFLELRHVVAVEWADRFPGAFEDPDLTILLEHLPGERRRVTLRPGGEEMTRRISELRTAWEAR
ncbi:MAG: tRNA (adenosine(37)-N6)-threonylcarbamoyltransferase complex ATPase subunit type 1 TsaE [Planctomycetota bacterium]